MDIFVTDTCPPLDVPLNGMIDCLLGDDGQPDPGDFCRFTCSDGFEIDGSDMRTCQNSSIWSGTEAICIIAGLFVIILFIDRNYSTVCACMHPTAESLSAYLVAKWNYASMKSNLYRS